MRATRPAIGFILVTVLLDTLGFGLLIPVAPSLIEKLEGWNEQQAAPYVGLLAATYAALQFVCAPVLGALSDHFGRRPVLLIALLGSGLDYFALALSPTLWVLFVTRAINGMSGASFSVANAYIADVTPGEKRSGAYALVGAAFGVGFMLGPPLGGILGDVNLRYPFYAAGALTLVNWMYGLLVLPESLPPQRRATITFARANPIGVFRGLTRYSLVAELALSMFFASLAQFGLHMTWALYTASRYGWSKTDIGVSLLVVGIGAAAVASYAGKLIRKIGEPKAILFGIATGTLAFVGYGAATQGWMIYAIIAVASVGGIGQPAVQSMITRTVRPDEQGRTQGALSALQNVAQIIGPLIATNVFAYFSAENAPIRIPGASFFSGAMLCAVSFAVAWWALARHGREARPIETEKAASENGNGGGSESGPGGTAH